MQPRDERGRFAPLCPDCVGQGLMSPQAACRTCGGAGFLVKEGLVETSPRGTFLRKETGQ